MWVLLIIIIGGYGGNTEIDRFTNARDCWKEQKRISEEMAEAYPDDAAVIFTCHYRARKV